MLRFFNKTLFAILTIVFAVGAFGKSAVCSQVRETRLSNGLTILTKEVRVAPVVSVNIFYRVGSRNEHTGITGVSHLLEHMMFKGTKSFPKGEFERLIRQRGGIENAATWTDFTYYWELLQSDYLELALKLEADRMRNALFDPADHKSEMVVVRSELEGRENNPDSLLLDLVNATAFTAHPYGWPIIGWRSDVEGMTRDEIYRYYLTHYGPNNATVVLVGDFDTNHAIGLVRKYFGGLKPIEPAIPPRTIEPEQRGRRDVTLKLAGSAERTIMAWHIPAATNTDNYALDVLEQILSGGRASRLYQALVETGLATEAWAYNGSKTDPSLFYVGGTVQLGKSNKDVEGALSREIEKIKTSPPSAEELARAKQQIEAAFVFSNEDVRNQAQIIGRFALTTGLKQLDLYIPGIQKVTPAEVMRAAAKYLVDDNCTIGKFTPSGTPQPESRDQGPAGPMRAHNDADWPHYRAVNAPHPPVPSGKHKKPATMNTIKPSPTRIIKPLRYVLDNGLILIVLNNPANPSISISGTIEAGSWLEPDVKKGAADFTAGMLDRGTKTRTSLQFAQAMEDMGASLFFDAGVEGVSLNGKCLSRDFGKWIALMTDALRNPSFSSEELEKLRREMLSRLQQETESPDAVASRAFMNKLYPDGHPYHPGTASEDESAYKALTRADIENFYSRYYGPKGMVLTIVGDITPEACKNAVEGALGDWQEQAGYKPVAIAEIKLADGSQQFIEMPDKAETTVIYGWPSALKRSSDDYYAAVVMNDILGGSPLSSRLGKTIRAKLGLVYDVGSGFQATRGAGPWTATLGTNPKNAAKAIVELRKNVLAMSQDGPTEAEVTESKQFITGALSLRLATNDGIAGFLKSAEIYGLGLEYLSKFRSLYGSVTPQQVKAAAKKYLHPEAATLVAVGPSPVNSDGENAK